MRGLLVALIIIGQALFAALPARAAVEDSIEHMGVVYDVRQDGTVDVEVTLDWRFGSSDSRGIFFTIMTAEPWDDDPGMQAVYRVENIDVSSPTGAADQFTTEEMTHASGHSETLLRIGDPNESVPSTEQTYVISYSLGDGIHEYDGVPEFHHDVTSRDFPPVSEFDLTISAEAGDIPRARCLSGREECQATVEAGTAKLQGGPVPRGEILTAIAELPAAQQGTEPNLQPIPEPAADETGGWSTTEIDAPSSTFPPWLMVLGGIILVPIFSLVGNVVGRVRFGSDSRYVGVPPGVIGESSSVTESRRTEPIPVRFDPPDADLELVGHVWHRQFSGKTVAAVITDLAVRGGIELSSKPLSIKKGDKEVVQTETEDTIHTVAANDAGVPLHKDLLKRIVKASHTGFGDIRKNGGYFKKSGITLGRILSTLTMMAGPFLVFLALVSFNDLQLTLGTTMSGAMFVVVAVLAVLLASAFSRGGAVAKQLLTAKGTALREQAEGFRQFIATAEARQLAQEAEQDIHRKYLPWAVLFGLTERWNEVCREMAAETHVEVPDASFSDAADDFTRAASSAVTQQQFNPFYTDPGMEDHSDNFWKSSDDSSSSGSSSGFSSSGGGSGSGGSRAGSW